MENKIRTWKRCECGCDRWNDKSIGDSIVYVCIKCSNIFKA